MRKIPIFLMFLALLFTNCRAEKNFYLTTRNIPQKLVPSTLSYTIQQGERGTVTIDTVPKDADISKISWHLKTGTDIISISQEEKSCAITALSPGHAVLVAQDEDGASCEIKIHVISTLPPSLRLSKSADTVQVGETASIHAIYEPSNAQIIWSVGENTISSASYGGSTCKIHAHAEGLVHIQAAIAGSNISSECTLQITSAPESIPPFLNYLCPILFCSAIISLLLSLTLYLSKRRRFK